MEQCTKASGKRISNTAMPRKFGQMAHAMKVITSMAKSMVVGSSNGQMDLDIVVNLTTTTLKVKALTCGLISEPLTVTG